MINIFKDISSPPNFKNEKFRSYNYIKKKMINLKVVD